MKDEQQIKGHRSLSEEEIQAINDCKTAADTCKLLISDLRNMEFIDEYAVNQGRAHIQTGFMWLVRSIARPATL